jgi:hypothetical protein
MIILEANMTSIFEQQCPLCHEDNAEYSFRDRRNLKHFQCGKKEFVISVRAERRLSKHISQRIAFSEKAKRSEGVRVLVITLASLSLRQEGVEYPAFDAKFLERNKLAQ